MESIIHDSDECYICGRYATDTHHCLHGSMRRLADADGLTVRLCRDCHRNLHDKGWYDRDLQKLAQERWMEYYHLTEGDFRSRYGKSYLT